MGHLLAQQLLSAGERVLDVQPKLGARVRLLAAGDTNKNDPDDARSVAVAALRSAGVREVRPDDHADGLRRPPREHLGLEHETARGTGSSGRRIRRLTGCRVRHVLDLGFHPVLNVRTATMAPHEHGVPGVSAAGAFHHMAAPVPGAPTSTLDPLPPLTFRSCRTGRM